MPWQLIASAPRDGSWFWALAKTGEPADRVSALRIDGALVERADLWGIEDATLEDYSHWAVMAGLPPEVPR